MKWIRQLLCIVLASWLTPDSTHAVEQTKPAARASAKAKAKAKAKAVAKGTVLAKTNNKIKAKGKVRAKAKVRAKKTKATIKGGGKGGAKVVKPNSRRASALAPRSEPVDEDSLDTEVAAARRILAGKPNDVAATDRLARATVVLIDLLLRAEAVGDTEKAQRLMQKLKQKLHDTGPRVQKLSQHGDMKARQAAGFLLGRGILLKRDPVKSCTEFLAAAPKLAPAGWHAAQCLMDTSPDKAWMQMERAAQQGHGAALEWMGRRCLGEFGGTQKDFACARNYFVQSASLGRTRATTLLAFLLINGQGGPADLSRAVRLYQDAAKKGDLIAQNNLGEVYETGRGVTRNLDEATRWYESAAEQGLASAQFNAGRLWAIGTGEKKDPVKARAFLVQAERNGVSQARQVLDWLDRQAVAATEDIPSLKPAVRLGGDTDEE